jgi:hypothetical protein
LHVRGILLFKNRFSQTFIQEYTVITINKGYIFYNNFLEPLNVLLVGSSRYETISITRECNKHTVKQAVHLFCRVVKELLRSLAIKFFCSI